QGSQAYFLVNKTSGEFGTGTGEEYGGFDPAHGTYLPLWMPLEDILNQNVVPRELAALVVQSHQQGWPTEPVVIFEDNN
ncbi:MAG: hypothetical protein Q7J80_16705, partial [Anaerolineales bacterium]|nr:hypothetical protein [Anaerolineales bacterium]